MLFNVTTIRLSIHANVFQETEFNGLMLLGDVERHLIKNKHPFSDFEKVVEMINGNSIELESILYRNNVTELTSSVGKRITYITKIS